MAVDKYPMTFNEGNIVLTIWGNNTDLNYDYMGYSEETAFTFEQIKEFAIYTDPTLVSEIGYVFKFVISLINKTVDSGTWLIDKNKQLTFTRELTSDSLLPTIQIGTYTHMRLGDLVNEEKKITSNGCQILVTKAISYDGGIGKGSVTYSYLELYGCDINFSGRGSLAAAISKVSAKVYNSNIQGGGVYKCYPILYNCNIISANLPVYYSSPVINNVAILNSDSLFRVRNIDQCVNARGVYARGYNYVLSIYKSGANNNVYASLVDCDLETWGTIIGYPGDSPSYNNYLYRKNSINITVKDTEGTPIQGALIIITNSTGDVVMEKTSDENGVFEEQILEVQRWTVNGLNQKTFTDFNPFTIKITKPDFQDYQYTVEILDKIIWNICLLSIIPPIYYHDTMNGETEQQNLSSDVNSSNITGTIISNITTGKLI